MKTDETVVITADSIRIDTFHAGEHSGFFHTSRTAVRITHLPTGVTVESRDEPTAWRNRQKCLDMLPAAIAQHRSAGCTCPSGDGSLRHPCPVHPASGEQAGGDERATLPYWKPCNPACDPELNGFRDRHCTCEQARAALTQSDEKPGDSILCNGCFAKGVGPDHFDEAGKCLAAQGEQAEPKSGLEGWRDAIRQLAEPEEAVGCQGTNCGTTTGDHSPECLAEAAASQGWELKPEDLGEVEVVAYLATAEHPKHGQPHKAINYFKDPHDAQVAHWRERGCTVTEDQLMTVALHGRRMAALDASWRRHLVHPSERYWENRYRDEAKENERLRGLIDSPELHDFAKGAVLEAAHQRERWGGNHDEGKQPADWFWLIGYLAQKAMMAQLAGDTEKALHHCISTAAAMNNWHAAILGANTSMRPGLPEEALPAGEGGAA